MLNAASLDRAAIETAIDALIGLLDAIDGDADIEDGDEDCCRAGDDNVPSGGGCGFGPGDGYPGDYDDAEDDCRRNRMLRYLPDDQRVMVTAFAGREFERRFTD